MFLLFSIVGFDTVTAGDDCGQLRWLGGTGRTFLHPNPALQHRAGPLLDRLYAGRVLAGSAAAARSIDLQSPNNKLYPSSRGLAFEAFALRCIELAWEDALKRLGPGLARPTYCDVLGPGPWPLRGIPVAERTPLHRMSSKHASPPSQSPHEMAQLGCR